MTDTTNPYLVDNFGPVDTETTAFDLPIMGELPTELDGRYLRNGPNPHDLSGSADAHWFIGDGMVHGVRLQDGKALWYRNRYVGGDSVNAALGLAPLAGPNWNDNPGGPNTNVGGFAGKIWAMVEAGGCPVELDGDLNSVARNNFDGTLPNGFSAHPKYDPATGELHAMCYAWPQLPGLQYVIVGGDGKVSSITNIDVPDMPMVHDMSLTETYALVYDFPVTIDLDAAFSGSQFPFGWNRNHASRVGLLARGGAGESIIWCDAPMAFAFHPLNAYDTADGKVIVDLCVYETMFDHDRLGPLGDSLPKLERWEIDPRTRTTSRTVVDERQFEFPRHAVGVSHKQHRYGYFVGDFSQAGLGSTCKFDYVTGQRTDFDHGAGRAAGESVFVGRRGGTDEDDGWLLSFVHDDNSGVSELVVLDAADLARPAVARVILPARVPYGFHGNWVPDCG